MSQNESSSFFKDFAYDFYIYPKFGPNDTLEDLSGAYLKYRENRVIPMEVTLVLCVIGLVLNSVNVWVFSRKSVYNSLGLFLIVFEISNMLTFCRYIILAVHYYNPNGFLFTFTWMVVSRIGLGLRFASSFCSNWLAVVIGFYRCVAVSSIIPIQSRRLFTKGVVGFIVFVSSAMLCGLCFTVTYEVMSLKINKDSNETRIVYRIIPRPSYYRDIFAYTVLGNLFVVALPILMMIVTTIYLLCSLSKQVEL